MVSPNRYWLSRKKFQHKTYPQLIWKLIKMTITLRLFYNINFYVLSWFTLVATLLKTSINEMYTSKWKFSSEILKEVGYVYAEFYIWRRKWQSTPVFLPRESHGQRNLVGYSPWDLKESDITEVTEHVLNTKLGNLHI